MVSSAIVGGVILGLIEGVSLLISRFSGQMMLNEQSILKFLKNYEIFIKNTYNFSVAAHQQATQHG
jgi:hypothetical protein